MNHSTVIEILWALSLLIPGLVFYRLNKSRSTKGKFTSAVVAVVIGWLFFFAYACAAQYLSVKSEAETSGAVFAFAAMFGWVLPLISVAITWVGTHRVMRNRLGNR